MTDGTLSPAEEIRRAALTWQITLWSGEVTEAERLAFERWLGADTAHERAWQQIQSVNERLHAVPGAIAGSVLRATSSAPVSPARRKLIRGLGLVASAGIVAYAVHETPRWRHFTANYSTARGERREVTLPDGTQLTLNTDTAVDLRFTEQERRVLLRGGEILVTTASEGARIYRPFVVETSEGSIRALGTRFTVRQLEGTSPAQTLVQVFEHAVEITPHSVAARLRVEAGRQTTFTATEILAPIATHPTADAWSRGLLIAEQLRLADFLAELSRYRTGVLRCDPAVSDLSVSGVYPLQDTDAILQSLARALPVQVNTRTRYWVTVTAKSSAQP